MVDPNSSPSAGSPGQSPAAGLSVLAIVLLAVGLIFGILAAAGLVFAALEARDLPFDALTFRINDGTRPGVSSYHPGGVNVGMCDGRVLHLPDTYPPEMFRGMATIDGGERTVRP